MFITKFIPSSFYDERNKFNCSEFKTLFGWFCDEKRQYKMFRKPNSKVMRLNYVSYYYEEGIIIRCTSFEDEDGDGYSFKDNIKYNVKEEDIDKIVNDDFIKLFGECEISKWSPKGSKVFTIKDEGDIIE